MQISYKKPAWYWFFSFVLFMIGGVLLRDGGAQPALLATIDHVNDGLGISDPGSFAIGAKDIFLHGWVQPANYWVVGFWPPGFMLLEGWLLKVFGGNAPIIVLAQVCACAMLATMVTVQRRYLSRFVSIAAASLLPFLIFVFPMPRLFLFEPIGIVMSETFSVSFFITAGLLMLEAVESGRLRVAAWAGLLYALSAYFRSQYEVFVMVATAVGVLAVVALAWRARKAKAPSIRTDSLFSIKAILLALTVAHVLMVPWRMHSYATHGNFLWVQTSSLTVRTALSTDDALLAENGSFVINGGGNLACKLEPDYCGKNDRSLFLKAFFQNPVKWISAKLALARNYWNTFSYPHNPLSAWFYAMDGVANIVFLLCLLISLPLLWVVRGYRWWAVLAWSVASLYGAAAVIFVLVHFESRYFYILKIFSFTTVMSMMAIWWRGSSFGWRMAR
ncbi:hypothetical protein [Achromobacter sp. AGC39]